MQKVTSFLSLIFLLSSSFQTNTPFIFPSHFIKGVANSSYQAGGSNPEWKKRYNTQSNWETFENSTVGMNAKNLVPFRKVPAIQGGQKVGASAEFWKRAIPDISLIKELGCNSYRFSIEWHEIEPQEGVFNEEAFTFYDTFIKALLKENIQPNITLLHFVTPQWFEDKGGFSKTENISHFTNYAQKVFERFSSSVSLLCTINEPTVVAACGYVLGNHAPGRTLQYDLASKILYNLLLAHTKTYHLLKSMKNGNKVQIGLVHQLLSAEAYDPQYGSYGIGTLRNMISQPIAQFMTNVFAHQTVLTFLKTGIYCSSISNNEKPQYVAEAKNSYDFIGLNFYSRVIVGPNPTCYPHQVMTDMEYAVRPETFYEAIKEVAQLNVPIYITENGIPDAKDSRREQFIISYLAQVHNLVKEGYDIRGYYYWTLMDNFEWNEGYNQKFGLYHVDFETQIRTLRKGSYAFRDLFKVSAV